MSSWLLILLLCLWPLAAPAMERYAGPNGSGSTCSKSNPCSLSTGLGATGAGDTLYLLGGQYSQNVTSSIEAVKNGTGESSRVVIRGQDPGNKPVLLTTGGNGVSLQQKQYVTFQDLVFDAVGAGAGHGFKMSSLSGHNPRLHHVRLQGCEFRNAKATGIGFAQDDYSSDWHVEIIGNYIHHNGSSAQYDHAIYVNASGNLIEGNTIADNAGCGIHNYSSAGQGTGNRNVVRNNRFYGHNGKQGYNGRAPDTGSGICGVGILLGVGNDNVAYNNVIYGNIGGIMMGNGGNNNIADNNTMYNQRDWCLRNDNNGTVFQNNICYQSGTTLTGGTSPQVFTHTLTSDPKFVNASAGDFHLQSGSPAINAGADTSSIVKTDFDGHPRSGTPDIGAYEYGSGAVRPEAPPAPTNLRVLPRP